MLHTSLFIIIKLIFIHCTCDPFDANFYLHNYFVDTINKWACQMGKVVEIKKRREMKWPNCLFAEIKVINLS